ncbi:hypothetical protein GTA08_BOTSDO01888 [Botryosphaeria dothidea]|uniref:Uncharacterized protein n=1 Tax=Botryosphaeria dothidea TaxID=55169 RepID=A0A8H4IX55_9PEZI|nr:hypothetical protein GTA08_BOTSDO01888 [Botryosphaeria dothidea]
MDPESCKGGDISGDDARPHAIDSEDGESIENTKEELCKFNRQIGFRSEKFSEWKEHFEDMAKLCQEAVDLRKERNDFILHWIQAIADEQHAGFDIPTDEDNGLSRLNQRARERKERSARRNVEMQ